MSRTSSPPTSTRIRCMSAARVDVVHGFGRLDVPGGDRGPARTAAPRRHVQRGPVHSRDVAQLLAGVDTSAGTCYRIDVANPEHRCTGVASATLDGVGVDPRTIPIVEDGQTHDVEIILGKNGTSTSSAQRLDSSYVT